jgi:hypothetical protein
MNRPPLEVADLVRAAGPAFIERSRRWIPWQHLKVLRAIARCRTAALGGHLDECTDCGYRVCQVFCVNDLDFVLGFGFVVALGFAVVVGFGDGVPGKGAFWSAPLD